ncbi:unnamed protein product [Symbiodinium sp. CCMP2592]|nr:unnamed protein product [Symbiodinium sp. CCMP2592]
MFLLSKLLKAGSTESKIGHAPDIEAKLVSLGAIGAAETGLAGQSEFLSLGDLGAIGPADTGQSDAALALNDDDDDEQANCIARATPAAAAARSEADDIEEVEVDVVADLTSQFPNAIIVHGLKHVADGALGLTLQSMNLYLECISGGRGHCQFIAMPMPA